MHVSQLDDKGYFKNFTTRNSRGRLPNNCVDALPPAYPWTKKWPRFDHEINDFVMVGDHRERSANAGFAPDEVQDATEFWLPPPYGDDNYQSPARTSKELGPLPAGASLTKPAKTPAEARTAKAAEINNGCESALRQLTTSYPDMELLSFDKQELEARAYAADPTAATPILSSIATGRGLPLAELAVKVIAKADAFAAASGYLIGQRQNYEDQLDALGPDATTAQIEALVASYCLPGAAGAIGAAQGS